MRIGYFADGPWSHRSLEKILSDGSFSVSFICARYDSPDQVLKKKSEGLNIPFLVHKNINSDEFHDLIKQYDCDIFVSMSFNQIFRKRIIELTPQGIINCHAGNLPFYRGRNVLNWSLINDESEFGITVHYVDEGIDTGDIIKQKTYPILDSDNYSTLLDQSYTHCSDILYEALRDICDGRAERVDQKTIHPVGSYCSQRREGDEILDWDQSSRDVFNFVRAICQPGPKARTYLRGEEIKINQVELVPEAPVYKDVAGAVLSREGNNFLVKTRDSFVKLVDWSSEVRIKVGDRLG